MKHGTTRRLHAYWDRIRGAAAAPRRSQVDPKDIRDILADTLILELVKDGVPMFRLAGTALCAAYCQELQGKDFLSLWSEADRIALRRGLAEAVAKTAPLLFEFTGTTERGYDLQMEGVLLPLVQNLGPADRFIGAIAPFTQPYWLGTQPLLRQRLGSLHVLYRDQPAKMLRRRSDVPAYIPPAPLPSRAAPAALQADTPKPPMTPPRRPALTVLEGGKR